MASTGAKQAPKIVSKTSAGGTGAAGASGGPPIMPLASPLMGKKKKPFLGMPAPLGYVPGLGRGWANLKLHAASQIDPFFFFFSIVLTQVNNE